MDSEIYNDLNKILESQKSFFKKEGPPDLALRADRLNRLKDLIIENRYKIVDALNEDFGVRSKSASMASDVYTIIPAINHAIKNLKKWTKRVNRKTNFPFNLTGGKSYIEYEPLGSVGMISPWNFPIYLTFAPLASIFAAGNQVIHKPSELTPLCAKLMKDICDKNFDEHEFATVLGGPEVGSVFTTLNFDHLLYTGSGRVGKMVMASAAQNLVPVTLELGGKSPVIIGNGFDVKIAAKRVMFGKTLNAGQICLAPDYVFVKPEVQETFIEGCKEAINEFFPDLLNNNDYTSIINKNHYDRLNHLLDDARNKGAKIIELKPSDENFINQEHHKIPPTLVLNVNLDMDIMHQEIFGPLLPIVNYNELSEITNHINSQDKPLGLYYFGTDKNEQNYLLKRTSSGGVTVNNVIGHLQQTDLPFGGVGPSGEGRYDAFEGFKNFSNERTYYKDISERFDGLLAGIRPPYKGNIEKLLKSIAK